MRGLIQRRRFRFWKSRYLWIWSFDSFSLTIHLWSWALPISIERYPGSSHKWTLRIRVLCCNLLLPIGKRADEYEEEAQHAPS